nr:MFS transporter [Escherichia coli]
MYYLKNTNFWMFGLFFFFYFFIMGAYFPFFPIWLHDINHISKSDTGIIFAAISLFSLLFQPLFGLLSDKLGLRKYLLWIITGMLVMFAPFFIFIFGPLLQYNILVGSIVGGIYLGFCFKEGANKRGNSSRLTQSFHFFMFEPIFSPVNALNQPI